ncbi:cytidine deaminase [Desulfonatronum sp. SC1]|uniref:cytidine deaminase n=1 Tax=Desulfonatronum sp. SC1 TaxID=2109626 RepID=UPI000D3222F5|nr:cytidine deaminase [Desulfonatronum sp. SC1]PTN32697.1 cytidine deaminase [Desulfonatronum sp. SC1]
MLKPKILFLTVLCLVLSISVLAAGTALADQGDRRMQLEKAIGDFPGKAKALLRSVVLDDGFIGIIDSATARELSARLGLGANETALALITLAKVYAVPPISNFQVGAVAVGLSGAMYFGCNMEFPGQALSFSVHAEQAATMNAWMHGETGLRAIAITAPPCGYCRQFLNELATADDLEILLRDAPPTPLRVLLPEAFGPTDLGMELRLMDESVQPLRLTTPSDDKVVLAALAAASTSYAPYSGNHAGVAIESAKGVIVSGRYAENAAYNPSMSPLAAALVLYNFANQDLRRIKRAVLVQTNPVSANQRDAAKAVLFVLAGNLELEEYAAVGE